ncbi:hypothetical protein QTP86_009169 [Hemibagrus guttatus]|nr:hypothetical protein QTP86_009169 [Hemibagrus guttatus]
MHMYIFTDRNHDVGLDASRWSRDQCAGVEELQTSHSFEFYTLSEKQMDYRILYVDEDQDRMYVGCKDHLLSMDINNITQGTLKVSHSF